MKKLLSLLLILSLLFCTACASNGTTSSATTEPTAESSPVMHEDEAIIAQLKAAVGEELWEKVKSEGYHLYLDFTKYVYAPDDGAEPAEGDDTSDKLSVIIDLRSPIGSTMYGEYCVDVETLHSIFFAILDSGAFDLTEDEKTELKAHCYTEDNRHNEVMVDGRYRMYTDDTPGGYEAMISMYFAPFERDIDLSLYDKAWSMKYNFDEISYNGRK